MDAIQGLGALQINLEQVECDFLCAGASKWLLSPHGIGMLYVSKETADELRPCNIGWLSAKWDDFEDFKAMPPLRPGAERLEEGTPNLIGIYAMRESLKIIADMGIPRIETKVTTLIDGLAEGLVGLDCEILTPLGSALRSGILSFMSPRVPARDLWDFLSESDVVCSLRGGWIRLSPHFYNTKNEIELVVDLVREQIGA